ncbi:hypothetical protein AAHA92_10321 [Salvia divinorum]|uniref:Myb/SANT-like domain-containing protein n=1 Tax=Salvia divinorum TaxID=28513 RepID=A0ABD1HU95_SALDI
MSMASKRSQFSLDDSQTHQPTNVRLGRNQRVKGDRTRRSWTDREEETLVIALKDIVTIGWKSDNGFRGGYLVKLERAMRSQFPTTDIKATPHIVYKIMAWKKCYGSLSAILNRSGIGFKTKGDYKIDCDDDQWDQIVKVDHNAHFMRNKSWPYWEDWQVIFRKDRASGSFTEDLMESVNELYSLEHIQESAGTGGGQPNYDEQPTIDPFDGMATPDGTTESASQTARANGASSSAGKKRKTELGIDGLIHMLEKLHEELDTLSLRIGY